MSDAAPIQGAQAFTPRFIAKSVDYVDEGGNTISEMIAERGIIPRDKRFRALGMMMLQTAQGNVPHQFFFYYGAEDIADAFAKAPDETKKAVPIEFKRIQDEQRRMQLSLGKSK